MELVSWPEVIVFKILVKFKKNTLTKGWLHVILHSTKESWLSLLAVCLWRLSWECVEGVK